LLYSSGNSFFYLENIVGFSAADLDLIDGNSLGPSNQCAFIFGGTQCEVISLSNCYFQPTGTTGALVYFDPACNPYAVTITGNQCNINNWDSSRDVFISGKIPTRFVFANNEPVVPDDVLVAVNLSGTTLNVSATRSEMVLIGSVTAASVISTITGNADGRVLILKCNTAGVTLSHNATILLTGGVNMIFTAGGRITLINMKNGSWEELSRSN